ncbi:hypothetical protein I6N95_08165 [Vagococcus sp. BWB3-3]|uniref:WXG100 family type VII secretion target n=1 Tax=Vagococcus allomyrinae TaxID=2794353 RepID=A0A940PA66_9ENTE|nr:hypothetical protein [Vagococcus allomyrinae]MBP1040975.1 hypothetical protein [Vagococcus allomyrinae]
MADIEIRSSDLSEIVSLASDTSEKLRASLSKIDKLLSVSKGYDQTWSGESKDSFLMYLGIVSAYHKDVSECFKDYQTAVTALSNDSETFDASDMGEIRRI